MKQMFTAIAASHLMLLTACGQSAQTDESATAATQEAERSIDKEQQAELVRSDNADEPEIGDRVPEPDASSADTGSDDTVATPSAGGVTEIGWEELMPEGEEERIAEMYQARMSQLYSRGGAVAEGSARDQAVQIGTFNTVDEINGQVADGMKVRIPGYTVPFDYGSEAKISEFLLVPYYGACLHAPPPPPNQTIYVSTEDKIQLKDLSQAVWIEGTLRLRKQTSDLADTAYVIEMSDWEVYEY